ncbi:MAG: LysE family transporter [Bacteroidota bacterium]
MRLFGVEICAYLMGFIAAIPLGATQLEIARRSLHGHPRAALMVMAGSVFSDTMYGVFAFFGIAPFLQDEKVLAVFWLLNAVILLGLAFFSLRRRDQGSTDGDTGAGSLESLNVGFVVGFSLAVTNPLMILWWLLGARFVIELGLIERFDMAGNILFLLAGAAGIGSYLTLLALGVHRAKHFLSARGMQRLTKALAAALLVLAGVSAIRSAFSFFGHR